MLALFNPHYPLLHPLTLDPQKGSHLSIFGVWGSGAKLVLQELARASPQLQDSANRHWDLRTVCGNGVRGSGHGGGGTALGWAGPTAGGMPTTDAGGNARAHTIGQQ